VLNGGDAKESVMTTMEVQHQVQVVGEHINGIEKVLSREAKHFLIALHNNFEAERKSVLAQRDGRLAELASGNPDFLTATSDVRRANWSTAPCPADLLDRRVEITGPVERKMMINALNSGAKVFMADFEDSLSPTWSNIIDGQLNSMEAVRKTLAYKSPEGKDYKLNDELATLVIRPRGWHLVERHCLIEGQPISASLFDFGLYFFHNAKELLARGSGPYFYLPKLESHVEARLWNNVFNFAQDWLEIPRGTIRATVLIETILAAFEMEEILFELKEHASGLNAGRWDYIFSLIKKCGSRPEFVLPDRVQVTMAVPFMRAYAQLLVKTCHKRGAHAIGGMAAFIPSRKDAAVNETAMSKVKEDKTREAGDGFDGTWVAHPDLVPVARQVFDSVLGAEPNQKTRLRDDVAVSAEQLLNAAIEGGKVTRNGVELNIDVALQYIESWLRGTGAAAIHNLMEDAATAEISRAQLWQWLRNKVKLDDGATFDRVLYSRLKDEIIARLNLERSDNKAVAENLYQQAGEILDELVLRADFVDFLTVAAYGYLA
jgi:malate synthase